MNPAQTPGSPTPGGAATPPVTPSDGSVVDIPEEGFGFADEQPQSFTVQPVAQHPLPMPPVTSPAATPPSLPPRPIMPAPQPQLPPAPIVVPTAQPLSAPAPAPAPTLQPVAQPMPADIMPPAEVPTIPTLTTPAAAPAPAPPPQPTPAPVAVAAEPLDPSAPFDPAKVPVHASSTPENPITATYTPQNVTHLPDDIAARIGEQPMQNSGDIMRQIKHGLDGTRLKSVLSFLAFTAAIFAAAFLINQFIFQSYYVEGTSMTPTLQNNDRLIISKVERTLAAIQGTPYIPERGQIVVLDSSIVGLNGQHEQLIKRVIGLPGDHIHIEAGTVIVTNTQHPNGYDITKDLGLTNLQATYSDTPIDLDIPSGHVYVMGDNREQGGSYDSRAFGAIEGDKIQGRLWGRILPLDKAQLY